MWINSGCGRAGTRKKGVDGRKNGEGSGGQKEDGWAKIWKKSEENLEKQANIHGFMYGKRMI